MMGSTRKRNVVSDGWTDIKRNLDAIRRPLRLNPAITPEATGKMTELADFQKMNQNARAWTPW